MLGRVEPSAKPFRPPDQAHAALVATELGAILMHCQTIVRGSLAASVIAQALAAGCQIVEIKTLGTTSKRHTVEEAGSAASVAAIRVAQLVLSETGIGHLHRRRHGQVVRARP